MKKITSFQIQKLIMKENGEQRRKIEKQINCRKKRTKINSFTN